jgi:hypothetical protein
MGAMVTYGPIRKKPATRHWGWRRHPTSFAGTVRHRKVISMHRSQSRPSLRRLAKAAIALEVLLSVGAAGGGAALMLGPRGQIIPLPLSALQGSPFDSYFMPGLVLFGILGLGPLCAAALAWLRHPLAPLAATAVGVALLAWLAVEIAIIGYTNNPPLQPFYLVLGVAITVTGLAWLAEVAPAALRRGHQRPC